MMPKLKLLICLAAWMLAPGVAAQSVDPSTQDALAWRQASTANEIPAYQTYLEQFPDGLFADLAGKKIRSLRAAPQPATVQEPNPPASTPAAATPMSFEQNRGFSTAPQSLQPVDNAPPSQTAAPYIEATSVPQTQARVAPVDQSVEAVTPAERAPEDRAYIPPTQAEPDLPILPPTPVLLQKDYPDCREDHLHLPDPHDKAININSCTIALDNYYTDVLVAYRKRMNEHQDEISAIYTEKVAGRMEFSAASRDRFFDDMMLEHGASDPDGKNMAVYRAAEKLYELDRNYLSDRYCYNTGCNGYPVPDNYGYMNLVDENGNLVEVEMDADGKMITTEKAKEVRKAEAKKVKKAKKRKKSKKGGSCAKSRGRGQLLGSIFGGVVGAVAGLDDVGTLLASAVGAALVGEIACKLDKPEQEKAVEATMAVTQQEKVGAVAEWKSPTRGGVSGSSTVTALNVQPNGRKCMTITDVAIIDGEETRISKQMCRGAGDKQYAITA